MFSVLKFHSYAAWLKQDDRAASWGLYILSLHLRIISSLQNSIELYKHYRMFLYKKTFVWSFSGVLLKLFYNPEWVSFLYSVFRGRGFLSSDSCQPFSNLCGVGSDRRVFRVFLMFISIIMIKFSPFLKVRCSTKRLKCINSVCFNYYNMIPKYTLKI